MQHWRQGKAAVSPKLPNPVYRSAKDALLPGLGPAELRSMLEAFNPLQASRSTLAGSCTCSDALSVAGVMCVSSSMVSCWLQVVVSTISPHYGEEACLQVGNLDWPQA